jgi:hypothetical protein
MRQFFTSKEEYLAVLNAEREILLRFYYKPDESATGHYNTAASVLAERIKELEEQK